MLKTLTEERRSPQLHDKDNDDLDDRKLGNNNCAVDRDGAWWYKYCSNSNLNGIYKFGGKLIH